MLISVILWLSFPSSHMEINANGAFQVTWNKSRVNKNTPEQCVITAANSDWSKFTEEKSWPVKQQQQFSWLHREHFQKLLESCFNLERPDLLPPPNHYFHSSPAPPSLLAPGPWVAVTRFLPLPLFQIPSPTSSAQQWFESDPPPLPPALALTQAYCPLWAAQLNSDCWLVVEMEKEAFGVFIETL